MFVDVPVKSSGAEEARQVMLLTAADSKHVRIEDSVGCCADSVGCCVYIYIYIYIYIYTHTYTLICINTIHVHAQNART